MTDDLKRYAFEVAARISSTSTEIEIRQLLMDALRDLKNQGVPVLMQDEFLEMVGSIRKVTGAQMSQQTGTNVEMIKKVIKDLKR